MHSPRAPLVRIAYCTYCPKVTLKVIILEPVWVLLQNIQCGQHTVRVNMCVLWVLYLILQRDSHFDGIYSAEDRNSTVTMYLSDVSPLFWSIQRTEKKKEPTIARLDRLPHFVFKKTKGEQDEVNKKQY